MKMKLTKMVKVLVLGMSLSLLLYLAFQDWKPISSKINLGTTVANIYVKKPATRERVAQEMQERRQHLDRACQQQLISSDKIKDFVVQPKKFKNFIVDDKHKTLYCYVPKVACTNWKKLMLMLEDGSNMKKLRARNITQLQSVPHQFVHAWGRFLTMNKLKVDDIRHRLQNYTKFLIVRHPLERTLSAFINKLVINTSNAAGFKKNYGVHIIKNYREGVKPEEVPASGEGVTFSEYVSYVTDNKPEQLNEHWAPASTLCLPCSVSYDVIGKYETLVRDSEYILEQIGAPPSLHFPEHVATKTTALLDSYLATLTSLQLSRLLHFYQQDFINFDYHYNYMI